MPVVFIPTPLRDMTAGAAEVTVEGSTVRDVVDALDLRYPGIKQRLCHGDSLAPGLQVSIDHVMTTRGLLATVRPESERSEEHTSELQSLS